MSPKKIESPKKVESLTKVKSSTEVKSPIKKAKPESLEHRLQSTTGLGNPIHGDADVCASCGDYKDYLSDGVFMCFMCD